MQKFPLTIILEDIRSALNVGAIFRTCDAVGAQKLILAGITPYPPHNKIPKTALGAVEHVDWEHEPDIKKVIEGVHKEATIVAVEITNDAKNLFEFELPRPVALVFGNEITGVSDFVLKNARAVVKIPMYGNKESLNVATTVGICAYEAVRQMTKK